MRRQPKQIVPPLPYRRPLRWVDRTGGPTLEELAPTRWHDQAACAGRPPRLWLDDFLRAETSPGIMICRSCPVRRECLASALVYGDAHGIYGGTTAPHRADLTRRLRAGQTLGEILDAEVPSPPSRGVA